MRILSSLTAAVLLFPAIGFAQLYDGQQTLPPFGSYHGSDFDTVSLQNGNLHARIPVRTFPQRGKALSWTFMYDTSSWTEVWVPTPTPTNPKAGHYTLQLVNTFGFPFNAGGWRFVSPFSWSVSSPGASLTCPTQSYTAYSQYAVTDPEGAKHPLPLVTGNTGVTTCAQVNSGLATDGSGMLGSYNLSTGVVTITLKDGTTVGSTREDSNGNIASSAADTLNRNPVSTTTGSTVNYLTPLGVSVSGPQYTLYTITDTNGNAAVYRFDYTAIDVQTSFCGGGIFNCNDISRSWVMPSKLTLPNGTTYQFSYVNNSTGELQQVILPTGGSISYTYVGSCLTHAVTGSNPTRDCRMAVQTRTVTQGSQNAQWTYTGGIVTDPYGNDEVHTWSNVINGSFSSSGTVETKVQTYSGCSPARSTCTTAGTVLRTVQTDYASDVGGTLSRQVINIRPIRTTTTLDNGLVTKSETDYDTSLGINGYAQTWLNPTEKREYDYGSGAPGALLRRTDYVYLHTGNQNYITRNIADRVTTTTVYDGSGNQIAQTVNEYDNYSHTNQTMQASSAIQHDAAYSTSFVYRGNVTAISHWLNTTSSLLTSTNQFDDAGNVLSTVDPLSHKTTFDFTDSWANTACAPSGQTKAYLTKVTNALNQFVSHKYLSCSGLLGSTTDANSNQTTFQYDELSRPTKITYPAQVLNGSSLNGVTNYTYNDTPGSLNVEKTKSIDSTRSTDEFYYFDALGRSVSHSAANDESTPWDKVDTCYDLLDRKVFASYPYQASSPTAAQVCSGAGDSFSYDVLSRVTQVTHSDGTSVTSAYTGRAVDDMDEGNGTHRVEHVSQTDALGRLVTVCEVTGTTLNGAGGTPAACGQDVAKTGFLTSYSYDMLNNLAGVTQNGLNPRSFVYDSLSRLVTDTNPETGTMSYSYDADSNVVQRVRPAPNQTSSTVHLTTTYGYDTLNRLASETYSDGTPPVTIKYDEATAFGITLSNTVGRKSSEYTGPSTAKTSGSVYSYDSMGHVVNNSQCTPQNCGSGTFSVLYTYDLLGNQLTNTDGVGHTFTSSYNRAERLLSLSSSLASSNYPGTLISGNHFNSFGSLISASLGNGVSESYSYTARGWVQSGSATLGATNKYNFSITNPSTGQTGYSGNGDLLFANDSVNGNWAYTYDDLDRLVTSSKGTQAFSYVYDRFGNRWQQIVTAGSGPQPSYSFDANHRITGAPTNCTSGNANCYDAAGDMLNDSFHAYTYDGENRIASVDSGGTGTYVYDATGDRIRKTSSAGTVDYIYDLGGRAVAEVNTSGGWNRVEIFAGGRHLATYLSTGTLFAHTDWLGTERLRTNATGGVDSSYTSLPFGDSLSSVGSSPLHFTGKMRDAETGLDEFPARYYSSTQGRWLSPDWSPVPVAIPYAKLRDPRTLNLYAFVGDDPTNHSDPDGHEGANQPAGTGACRPSDGNGTICGVRENTAGTVESQPTDPQQVQNQKQEEAQVPTSLKVLDVKVLPTGTTGDYGALPSQPYGIYVDIKYQVLDQKGDPIKSANMTPTEEITHVGGTVDTNPVGPTRVSTTSRTTAADGTFHDAPVGGVANLAISAPGLTIKQKISITTPDGKSHDVRTQSFTVVAPFKEGHDHGHIKNALPGGGSDISADR